MRSNAQENPYGKNFFLPNLKLHISSKSEEKDQFESNQSFNKTIKYFPFFTDITIDIIRKLHSPSRVISYKVVDSITSHLYLKKKAGEIKNSEKKLNNSMKRTLPYRSLVKYRSKSPVKLSYNMQKISNVIKKRVKTPTNSTTPVRYATEIGCQIDFD